MVSGANVMDFRIENVKSTTLGGTRLTRRWIVDLQKMVARFPALSRHELASTLCSHLGWFTPKGRDRLGSCRSPAAVLAPEDALVRLWQRRRRVLNTLVVVLCMFRLVFWKGRPGYEVTASKTLAGWRRSRDEEQAKARRGPVGASDGERGPAGADGGGHGMKSKQKRGADRLVRRMAKGVRPARMEVDCSGGELSANGGSALLMMLAEQVRLFERASACFTDHRDPSKVAHPLVALLGQRILGLALGYEDVNDHDELRRDRALSTAHGACGVRAFGLRAAGRQKHAEPDGAVGERAGPGESAPDHRGFRCARRAARGAVPGVGRAGPDSEAAGAGHRCHGRGTARPAGAPVLSRVLP